MANFNLDSPELPYAFTFYLAVSCTIFITIYELFVTLTSTKLLILALIMFDPDIPSLSFQSAAAPASLLNRLSLFFYFYHSFSFPEPADFFHYFLLPISISIFFINLFSNIHELI